MYSLFKTDQELEKEGIWQEYFSDGKPVFRVKVARSGENNTALVSRIEALFKPHRRAIEIGTFPLERKKDLSRIAFAEVIIRDWQVYRNDEWVTGIESETGEILPFNAHNVVEVFKKLPDLQVELQSFSFDMSAFMSANRESDAKN